MIKEFLQSHFFLFKTNVLTLAIKLNALGMLLETVIFSALKKKHLNPASRWSCAVPWSISRWQNTWSGEQSRNRVAQPPPEQRHKDSTQQHKLFCLPQECMCGCVRQVCGSRRGNIKYWSCLGLFTSSGREKKHPKKWIFVQLPNDGKRQIVSWW